MNDILLKVAIEEDTIQDEAVKEREVSVFHLLDDGYKKILITMDRNPLSNLENGYQMSRTRVFILFRLIRNYEPT